MAICRYFQNGNCRFGDRCKNDHIGPNMSSNNRFAALGNPRDNKTNGNSSAIAGFAGVDRDTMIKDLSTERPQWILSCYAPGRNPPEQLFGGPLREQSFEEIRLKFYTSPNVQQTAQEVDTLIQNAEQQMKTALSDPDGASKFLMDAVDKHPNRNDLITAINSSGTVPDPVNPILNTTAPPPTGGIFGAQQKSTGLFGSTPTPSNAFGAGTGGGFGKPSFGAPAAPVSTGAFGQPSTLGAKPNPFGAGVSSGFGQPSTLGGGGGGFGQPSALGQKPNPFSATTSMSFGSTPATTTSAAPSGFSSFANGGSNTFGAANPFAQKTPAFGQPSLSAPLNAPTGPSSMNNGGNAFGKPSTFGQPTLPPPTGPSMTKNPFSSTTSNAFGAPATTAPMNPMTAPAFGRPAFGQPAAPGGFGTSTGGFGRPAIPGFGQPSQPQNPLTNGNINGGGGGGNPFGAPAPTNTTNPFGAPAPAPLNTITTNTTPANPFAKPQINNLNSFRQPLNNSSTTTSQFSNLNSTSIQKKPPQSNKRLFPNGPPPPNTAAEPEEEELTDDVRKVWEAFRSGGGWEFDLRDGGMPLVAPRREWVVWDF